MNIGTLSEWMKLTSRPALGFVFATAPFVFGSNKIQEYFGLSGEILIYRGIASFIFLFSLGVLLYPFLEAALKLLMLKGSEHKKGKAVKEKLAKLTTEQRSLLMKFVDQNDYRVSCDIGEFEPSVYRVLHRQNFLTSYHTPNYQSYVICDINTYWYPLVHQYKSVLM